MQLYKKRDFGTLIADSLTFIKVYGRNFFKNYLIINGLLLIALVIMFVIGYRSMFAQIFEGNMGGQSYYFEQYFQDNAPVLIAGGIIFFIIMLAAMLISYTFPVLYLKRLAETNNSNITTDQMLGDIKKNIGKFFIFFLGVLLIMGPLMFVFVAINSFLFIIGMFFMMLAMPFFLNVVNFTLYDYFNTNNGFFSSLSYGFRSQFSYPNGNEPTPFWKYWGSTIIIYFIVTIASYIFTLIPAIILIVVMFVVPMEGATDFDNPKNFFEGTMGIALFSIYGISILFMMLLSNLIYINSGLSYYDSRTDLHRNLDLQEIDSIGTGEA